MERFTNVGLWGPTTLRVMAGWTMLIHDLSLSNLATVFISFQVGIVCFHNIGFVAPFGTVGLTPKIHQLVIVGQC